MDWEKTWAGLKDGVGNIFFRMKRFLLCRAVTREARLCRLAAKTDLYYSSDDR